MSLTDLAGISGAIVGDLEMEITKMDAEISYLTKELEKAERFKAEAEKFSGLWRAHLDDSYLQDDDEQEATARQILWNDSDAQNLAEYEKSEAGYIPF